MTAPTDSTAPVSYGSYLALDELLTLQRQRAVPEHPDELLFIVVHQASELWFKCMLHEMDHLIDAMERGAVMYAVLAVRRLNALVQIVAAQLAALETLPPQHFAQFRGYLGSSSGSQSAQFRALEAASGTRDQHFMHVIQEHGDIPPLVQRALARPTLEQLFERLVEREGATLESLYTGPAPTPLFLLAEGLLEYDSGFARWRFLHVQLVERIIGPDTGGTGGTLGARYLQRTVSQRFLPRLWAVRAKFFGGPRAGEPAAR
ncbi:MAG TPA: tryptophan 2,3-dioxygenase family protein [Gemmatimonadaceae bacterium]|nr:tryptophan 2,3-dioxygenase family protein [Gemmatimonadaceae bacterium]